jgi:hypothetical protein
VDWRAFYAAVRREAMLVYGDGSCAECGWRPRDVVVLELDHVNGDGAAHRKALGLRGHGAGSAFCKKLRALGWPTDWALQTLCHDCHVVKHRHERAERARRQRRVNGRLA